MKVLVTGGAGFIASHITDRLIQYGHEVAVIDNLSSGSIENVNVKATFYNIDICDPEIDSVFQKEQPQIVIHHAAQVSVPKSIENTLFDARVNIIGSVNLFETCLRLGVRKIIYASSAAVYGEPQYLGIDEKHPVEPLSFYGISKHTPEHYLKVLNANYGLEFSILRYANVYGPRQGAIGEGGVVSTFLGALLHGSTPTIFGSGQQTRDFVFVSDVVDANIRAMVSIDNEIINISTNCVTSINDLYRLLRDLLGSKTEPYYEKERPGDILHSYLNNEKAYRILEWQPRSTLQEGLKMTLIHEK